MIRYSLKCAEGHVFESWFRDSAAFDSLATANRIACAVCGGAKIEKTLMAPALGSQKRARPPEDDRPTPPAADGAPAPGREGESPAGKPAPALSGPAGPVEQVLTKLRQHLAEKADYVGRGFAEEARRVHLGESDKRAIWGEASPEEARALDEEGIPVAPLPFLSRRDD